MALTKVTGTGLETLSDGVTITTADNTDQLTLISTDADAASGPNLRLFRNSASPADNDQLGSIFFSGEDDGGNETNYAQIDAYAKDVTNGTEDGLIVINSMVAGTSRSRARFSFDETVFNQDGVDLDFRVESNGNANMLFVDGGNDRVGIGVTPSTTFHVKTGTNENFTMSSDSSVRIQAMNDALDTINTMKIGGDPLIFLGAGGDEWIRIVNDGTTVLGKTAVNIAVAGIEFHQVGSINITRAATTMNLNRITSDGEIIVFHKTQTDVGSIDVTGSGTSYNTSSDYRLKENVDYSWDATARLKQLKPARFNFIIDDTNTLVDGFLAHEVSSIVPEAITGAKDAMTTEVLYVEGDELPDGKSVGDVKEASVPKHQRIDQSKLVPLLVKTIQELEARITALE